ncbi:gamma-glutamyltransferase 2. Threonine peptidase. MEROPS family T03 [Micromonospora haikouensis]|uniref:Gamma-glutamyltransferase 2. Threonine peptidase. MEROPS family T03 n=1 Tax=Micromonospora haikouensis TaxID=686309 RepID=A0A1C4WKM6_9ACTN|nr:gamma-glutamyltransferase [Micromonospora haikouensis]SCE96451.1 gamma-glutamyltransferase 2. Threonine peptidase. MEROPS family T03 [Micromonospora haikouensis]
MGHESAPAWHVPHPTVLGTRHAVSSGHYLASSAALAILDAGGNAVDAGCCAGMALAVLHADEVNFAGVAPIMIRMADGTTVSIDGLGVWPAGIPADLFQREHGGAIPRGLLRTVVPAAPDAWITALRDYGTMSFGQVAEAAIRLARDGFAAFPLLVEGITARQRGYRNWPANEAIYLPEGRPPRVGERFVQTDLARSIQLMADAEAATTGGRLAGLEAARAVFYEGELAERMVAYHRENGGYLTARDLADFRCRYEPVLTTRWRDFDVLTCGAWCQGPTLAQTLQILEAYGLQDLEHNSPGYVHLVVEALKGVFSDREHLYGDPAFVDVDVERLLSTAHAAARAAGIDADRAHPGLPDLIFGTPQQLPEPQDYDELPVVGEGATSYVCVVDAWGNAFSATPSDGASTSPVIPGTGFVPSLRGMQSRPDPAHPSGVAPGKRPRLTPNPAIVVRDDGSVMPFGCPGGDMQVQAMVQVFLNAFHFGMPLQEAVNAPRFSTWSFPNSFAPFDYLPSRLFLEDRFPAGTLEALRARGHDVRSWPPFTRDAAAVEAIYRNARTGFLEAAADPRQPAAAYVS